MKVCHYTVLEHSRFYYLKCSIDGKKFSFSGNQKYLFFVIWRLGLELQKCHPVYYNYQFHSLLSTFNKYFFSLCHFIILCWSHGNCAVEQRRKQRYFAVNCAVNSSVFLEIKKTQKNFYLLFFWNNDRYNYAGQHLLNKIFHFQCIFCYWKQIRNLFQILLTKLIAKCQK